MQSSRPTSNYLQDIKAESLLFTKQNCTKLRIRTAFGDYEVTKVHQGQLPAASLNTLCEQCETITTGTIQMLKILKKKKKKPAW